MCAPGRSWRWTHSPAGWTSPTRWFAARSRQGRLAIDSDAHTTDELRFVEHYGIGVARRGWATPRDVINTLPVEQMLAALKGGERHLRAHSR